MKKIIGEKIMMYIFLKMDLIANFPYRYKPNSNDEEEKIKFKINKMYETYSENFVQTIDNTREEEVLFNEHISKEIKNLLICLKSLSELKRENVEFHIDTLKSIIYESNLTSNDKHNEDCKELALYDELFPES